MQNVCVIKHPLMEYHLAKVRCKDTPPAVFREAVHCLSSLLTYEAARDLATEPVQIQTPICETTCQALKQRIGLLPILRAGLGMVDAVLSMVPEAEVRHLGFKRNETTFKPEAYYNMLSDEAVDVAFVLDPMLATGGSAVAALKAVYDWKVPQVKLLAMIAAPEGLEKICSVYPQTQIYVCAIDDHLNENAYIVPGLGDAGDRLFNTLA